MTVCDKSCLTSKFAMHLDIKYLVSSTKFITRFYLSSSHLFLGDIIELLERYTNIPYFLCYCIGPECRMCLLLLVTLLLSQCITTTTAIASSKECRVKANRYLRQQVINHMMQIPSLQISWTAEDLTFEDKVLPQSNKLQKFKPESREDKEVDGTR